MPQVRSNGIDIEYESFGRDGDPVILLIMGYGAQMIAWPEALCEGLAAKGFRVVRFDNRDIGKSTRLTRLGAPNLRDIYGQATTGQRPTVPYTLDDMADDTVGLLDALGIDKAHIVGASMGGMIAQLVVLKYPARAKSLISIMSTTARPGLPPGKPETMAALTSPPASDSREDRIAAAIRASQALASPGYPTSDADRRARAEREADRGPWEPTGFTRQMAAIIATSPRHERLQGVHLPALVIHGAEDPILPLPHGQDTAACIPGAELIVVPGMAHDFAKGLVPIYLEHIGDFAARVEGRVAA